MLAAVLDFASWMSGQIKVVCRTCSANPRERIRDKRANGPASGPPTQLIVGAGGYSIFSGFPIFYFDFDFIIFIFLGF